MFRNSVFYFISARAPRFYPATLQEVNAGFFSNWEIEGSDSYLVYFADQFAITVDQCVMSSLYNICKTTTHAFQ